jgi:hypothetical protein
MLTGLEILIARMKDHPEEFLKQRKWDELIEHYGDYFTEEERSAYKTARSEMMRDLFNEAVLKRLAGEEDDEGQSQPSIPRYSASQVKQAFGMADPRAMYGQPRSNQMITAKQMEAMKLANEAMQQSALQKEDYSRQLEQQRRGMQNSLGSLGNFIHPSF